MTNKQFISTPIISTPKFVNACIVAGKKMRIERLGTTRQASKFRAGKGIVYRLGILNLEPKNLNPPTTKKSAKTSTKGGTQ